MSVGSNDRWTVLARVDRGRGLRGEFLATNFTADPDRIRQAGSVHVIGPGADSERRFPVEDVWEHQGRLVIKLGGVDSIEDAERLRGCDVCVPREERLPASEGEYHVSDLIGCRVEDPSGREVGTVVAWQEAGGPMLLEVRPPGGGEILVPFARSICLSIDPAAKRIIVELPEGLEDLNRA